MTRGVQRSILSVLVAATLLTPHFVRAETADEARIRELQARYDVLEQEAAAKRAIIATTQAEADSLKKAITILKNQIGIVQAQISATQAKIDKTKLEINGVQEQIGEKREDMSRKRETIGRLVFFMDQRDHESMLANLFKYTQLSEFVAQLHDVLNVQDRIMGMISDIKEVKVALEQDKAELEGKQQELEQLNQQAAQRQQQLAGVKGERARVLTVTKGQEAVYQKQLTTIEQQKASLFKELRELELKVISGGLYVVHVKADSVPPRGTKIFIAPEDNTHITQGYGMTKYAKRGAYGGAPHNGIDFSAGFGSPIKTIGDGQIIANGTNSGWGNWVAIQHPNNMVSVYGHMSSLSPLKVGTQVATGQVIGYEGSTGNSTGSHIHLSLYREFFTYIKEKDGQLYFNYFEGSVNPSDYL
ncbi:MAG: peptidoglycan DD-metalloendopeptidase family protein [Patescibacteria group bacterium]